MARAMFSLRILVFQVIAACCLCSLAVTAYAANPFVTQGGFKYMPSSGSVAPATGLTWDIVLGQTTVARSSSPAGWSASYVASAKVIGVQAPVTAALGTGYQVRIAYAPTNTHYSAVFDLEPGIKGFKLLPASVVGGGFTTGTITLTSIGTTYTQVSTRATLPQVLAPALITIPPGVASYDFTLRTSAIATDGSAIVTATCCGVAISAPLKLYAQPNLSFKAPLVYAVPSATDGIFAADMDGDGKADVITGGPAGWGILYGNGDGTLKPYTRIYQWAAGLTVRAVADLNGDGKPDVVSMDTNGNVLIFLNTGSGHFAAPQLYGVAYATGATVADFNNDGFADVLITSAQPSSYNGGAQVLLNKGNGTFKLGASWNPGFFVQGHAAAVLHNQKNMDIVLSGATESGSRVSIMFGDGKGNFTSGPTTTTGGINTGGAAIASLLGDGIPDIIVGTWGDGQAAVLYGNPDGSFASPIYFSVGAYTSEVRVAYMKGDGQPDIVAGRAGTNNIGVLLNQDGLFGTVLQVDTGGGDVRSIAIADMNGDGKPDVICQGNTTNTISVLLNNRP